MATLIYLSQNYSYYIRGDRSPLTKGTGLQGYFYSLISSLKTCHSTLHFTPWSLDLFIRVPFQLHGEHAILQPFRRIGLIVHISISVQLGTHYHLSQVKHLRVKCLAQGHTIETMSQDWDISLKIPHPAGLETARQAATSTKRHALTIAPCPSLTNRIKASRIGNHG